MITPWEERRLNYALDKPVEVTMQAEIDELRIENGQLSEFLR